jgi:hypothetical protein
MPSQTASPVWPLALPPDTFWSPQKGHLSDERALLILLLLAPALVLRCCKNQRSISGGPAAQRMLRRRGISGWVGLGSASYSSDDRLRSLPCPPSSTESQLCRTAAVFARKTCRISLFISQCPFQAALPVCQKGNYLWGCHLHS